MSPPVYLVDGARTPFLKARGEPGPFTPVDLAVQCGRALMLRQPFRPEAFDTVVLGCVNVRADEMNPARVAALRLGLGAAMTAYTVLINCGSGMQAIDSAFRTIREGSAEMILAGGTESLSHAPLLFSEEATEWFAKLGKAKGPLEKARVATGFEPGYFKPEIGLMQGLTDPVVELNMGQTAEVLAHLFDISREAADQYAVESHRRLARAQEEGWLDDEVAPAFDTDGAAHERDDGVRPEATVDKLAELKPAFEKPHGKVTPGNASQITDGACWTIVASESALERHGLTPIARIVDSEWAALDPSIMGLGPVMSAAPLLSRVGLGLDEVDLWELNEAFAAQVLSCLAMFADADLTREVLGPEAPTGTIPREKLNVDGGAISLGHPVGASGARITLHLANAMKRLGARQGVATECIGGGQGGAMLLQAA